MAKSKTYRIKIHGLDKEKLPNQKKEYVILTEIGGKRYTFSNLKQANSFKTSLELQVSKILSLYSLEICKCLSYSHFVLENSSYVTFSRTMDGLLYSHKRISNVISTDSEHQSIMHTINLASDSIASFYSQLLAKVRSSGRNKFLYQNLQFSYQSYTFFYESSTFLINNFDRVKTIKKASKFINQTLNIAS